MAIRLESRVDHVILNLKATQSNVDEKFRMLVPIYVELADGGLVFLGRAHFTGNVSIDQKIPLKGLKTKPRRVALNYYDDVLASPNCQIFQACQGAGAVGVADWKMASHSG